MSSVLKLFKSTYHVEKENGRYKRVDWHCEKIWKLPWAIHENIDVFSHKIDDLSLFRVFNLPLFQIANEFEEPTLNLGLAESEIDVDVLIVVASSQEWDQPQDRKEEK